jgi:dGTPase
LNIRELTEETESKVLCSFATLSLFSKGREVFEEQCPMRTVFARDRDRIIHCKAFRRLKFKTQVFLSPEGDHYRTRLTHTLEVSQIARTISRALRLNEDLTEAIALGHDLGHTPFGHAGEKALDEICSKGFKHYSQSLRVVDKLEREGKGLNLTWEVRNGIERHTIGDQPQALEGSVVRLSDRIAYINHDIDDAMRAGIILADELPLRARYTIGRTHSQRINTLITDTVTNSGEGTIKMSTEIGQAFDELHTFMFDSVYTNPEAKGEEEKAIYIIKRLYEYFLSHIELLSGEYKSVVENEGSEVAVCDYIAGMTDRFAIQVYTDLFVPKTWNR